MKNTAKSAKVIPFKKKKNSKKLAAIIGLTILVAFIALFTPWFNIKAIEVQGNSRIKQEDIINASGITIGQNIFRINYFHAKSSIMKNTYMEKINIKRNYPNKVTINVQERQRAGYVIISGKYVIIDKNGLVLEIAKSSKGIDAADIWGMNFKAYEMGKELKPNDEEKDKFDTLLNCLSVIIVSDLNGKLNKIDISDPENIVMWAYNDKYQVEAGSSKEFAYKLKFAKTIIDKQENAKGPAGTISFSSEHKAVFVPR